MSNNHSPQWRAGTIAQLLRSLPWFQFRLHAVSHENQNHMSNWWLWVPCTKYTYINKCIWNNNRSDKHRHDKMCNNNLYQVAWLAGWQLVTLENLGSSSGMEGFCLSQFSIEGRPSWWFILYKQAIIPIAKKSLWYLVVKNIIFIHKQRVHL